MTDINLLPAQVKTGHKLHYGMNFFSTPRNYPLISIGLMAVFALNNGIPLPRNERLDGG